MWTPDPSWQRLAAHGDAARVWLRTVPGRGEWVGKRLVRPALEHLDEADLSAEERASSDPGHVSWWRREADVVLDRWAEGLPGLRGPSGGTVEEDAEGVTVWWPLVPRPPADDLAVAAALGALTAGAVPDAPWTCQDLLGDRLREVARQGGWSTVVRTPAAEVATALWQRRSSVLARLGRVARVPTHGDVTTSNVLGAAPAPTTGGGGAGEPQVVACDWSAAGLGPVGVDLGYLTLGSRSRLEPMAAAYAGSAARAGRVLDHDEVLLGARVVMAYTVVTRLDRTLQRVAGGEGDWPAKLRHPSVAPAVRALQRVFPDVSPLLD